MICPVSSAYTIGVVCLHNPDALAVDFAQVIVSVILFTVLFADQIMICFTSAAHVLLVLSRLLNSSALATNLNRSLFRLFASWLFFSCLAC